MIVKKSKRHNVRRDVIQGKHGDINLGQHAFEVVVKNENE